MATFGERIIEALGGVTSSRLSEATSAAYSEGYYDGNDDPASGDIATGGFGYRRKTSRQLRDFSEMPHDRILDVVWTQWQSSPIAKRLMTLKRDHIVGHNTQVKADDNDLTDLLTTFWKNNKLHKRASEFCLQLFLLGEQCYPAFVRQSDGRTLLGYIDSGQIESVIPHPENAMEKWMVVLKGDIQEEKRVYRIIRIDEDFVENGRTVEPRHPGRLVTWQQTTLQGWEVTKLKDLCGRTEYNGSVFYFPVNSLSNQSRGVSDLVQVADWVDQADETLFALADREQMAGYFSFDVTLKGADDAAVSTRSSQLRKNPPGKGSVNVHNDSEEWQMWAPDLNQGGTIDTFIALLTFILGGMGYPVAWYGYGDDTNRSTLQEQATPSEKSLQHDQMIFKDVLMTLCQFARDQAIIAGQGNYDDEAEIHIDLPEIKAENLESVTSAFAPLVAALIQARDAQTVTRTTMARAVHKVLSELGIEIDTAAELDDVDGETEQDELDVEQARNNALNEMVRSQNVQPEANGS